MGIEHQISYSTIRDFTNRTNWNLFCRVLIVQGATLFTKKKKKMIIFFIIVKLVIFFNPKKKGVNFYLFHLCVSKFSHFENMASMDLKDASSG